MPCRHAIAAALLAALLALCAGCATLSSDSETLGEVVSLYGSARAASEIAAGHFGAVPVAVVHERDLAPAESCAQADPAWTRARCVKTSVGLLAWRPA
jgi:hypothetical protein